MTKRRVELFRDGQWIDGVFQQFQIGDEFRLYDEGIGYVQDPETQAESWIAGGDPYINEDGIWTVPAYPKGHPDAPVR